MIASPHRCTRAVGNGASRPRRKSWPVGEPYFYQLVAPVAIGKRGQMPDLRAATERQLRFRRADYPSTRLIANVRPGQIAHTHSIGMAGQGALRPPEVDPLGQARKRLARRVTTRFDIYLYSRTAPQGRRRCARAKGLPSSPNSQNAQLLNLMITRCPAEDNGISHYCCRIFVRFRER